MICCGEQARFWTARVKIRQHMYEAAEADLQKAVEEEEEEKNAVEGQPSKMLKSGKDPQVTHGVRVGALF